MTPARGPGELVACGLAAPGPRAVSGPPAAPGDLFAEGAAWKALTLWQPWASLMAAGVKAVVTMHYGTDWRGPVAIHAGRRLAAGVAPDDLCVAALGRDWRSDLPSGAIIAVGELVDVVPALTLLPSLTRAERASGIFTADRMAWCFANVRALRPPVPLAGRQGLFRWSPPDELHATLGPVLDPIARTHAIGWGLGSAASRQEHDHV